MVEFPRVSKLLRVDLNVSDVALSETFYKNVWGLTDAGANGPARLLRAGRSSHPCVSLSSGARPGLGAVHFETPSRESLEGLLDRALAMGITVAAEIYPLSQASQSGLAFDLTTPDRQIIKIQWTDFTEADRVDPIDNTSTPRSLSHIVLNSDNIDRMTAFFTDVLGFRLSDATHPMRFIRCARDHHSVALAKGAGPSINHIAFEMIDIDGLMYGAGRLREHGFDVEWGLGRHGPGNNVFCYFVEPNGFALEYTTGMQQIDDPAHQPGTPQDWAAFPRRPCRWNMAMKPSEALMKAFSGVLAAAR